MNLTQMRNLSNDWSLEGSPKPSDTSITNANKILEAVNREVYDIQPSVEGGVMIQFKNNQFGVFVECYNDGEIGYTLTYNGKSVSSVDMIEQKISGVDFISAIQTHLGTLRAVVG